MKRQLNRVCLLAEKSVVVFQERIHERNDGDGWAIENRRR
jgi:hypothetical protein